ncbi:MAG: hypothetical protein AAGG01_21120, partial [Planctomycetota bacterium]
LYAQWQEFDFPILWDPFGVMGLEVVPVVSAVDEFGVVRVARPDPRRFEESFLKGFMDVEYEATDEPAAASVASFVTSERVREGRTQEGRRLEGVLARQLLFRIGGNDEGPGSSDSESDLAWLSRRSGTPFEEFVAGVAMRLRHDGADAQAGDFQGALDRWGRALAAQPNQYIWRRRIQQWGPRLDKPYPFYDWVETAAAEVSARGETPVRVRARLSGSEVAGKTRRMPGARQGQATREGDRANASPSAVEPDPSDRLKRDADGLVALELAVAPHTASAGGSVRSPLGSSRIHVQLRPQKGTKWPLDADPPLVWLDLPDGWNAVSPAIRFALPAKGQEAAALSVDFEVSTEPIPLGPPHEMPPPPSPTIPAYVVYSICLEDGTCVFRRQDLTIQVPFPAPPPHESSSGGDDR